MNPRSHARRADSRVRDESRTSPHALDLDNYVPAYLTYLSGKISSSASATYRPKFGVGITDWRIMALLANEGWIGAGRICNAISLDKAAVSRSVREMQKSGLVEVRPVDSDQRRQLIALTRKGLLLHDRIVKLAIEREQRLLAGFSAAERKTLIKFLARMHAQLMTSYSDIKNKE